MESDSQPYISTGELVWVTYMPKIKAARIRIKTDKAAGLDGVPPEVIKDIAENKSEVLEKIDIQKLIKNQLLSQ